MSQQTGGELNVLLVSLNIFGIGRVTVFFALMLTKDACQNRRLFQKACVKVLK